MLKQIAKSLWQAIIRTFAFVSKEARTILHQPRLVFTLILGPFLILLIFGIGYRSTPRTLTTLFVVPEGSRIKSMVEQFVDSLDRRIEYAGITPDPEEADRLLRSQEVDLVVVTPPDPMADWEQGRQSVFTLYHYEIDPLEETYIRVLGQRYAEEVNRQTLLSVVENSQDEAGEWQADVSAAKTQASVMRQTLDAGNQVQAQESATELKQEVDFLSMAVGSGLAVFTGLEDAAGTSSATTILEQLQGIQEDTDAVVEATQGETVLAESQEKAANIEEALTELEVMLEEYQAQQPGVMVAPFRSETLSITDVQLEAMYFYVPGVIALLLQHLSVTLAGLSVIREKLGGAMELFRAAPVTAVEMLIGKYLSFLILIGVLAAILTGLVVWGLGVPQLGLWVNYALVILALLLASLGLGFHISLSARSDSQAIQFGMLTLLASIFFCGFFLPLYRLSAPVRVVSWILPATYGTTLLQEVMLRGKNPQWLLLLALFVFAGVSFLTAWWRLGRQLKRE